MPKRPKQKRFIFPRTLREASDEANLRFVRGLTNQQIKIIFSRVGNYSKKVALGERMPYESLIQTAIAEKLRRTQNGKWKIK